MSNPESSDDMVVLLEHIPRESAISLRPDPYGSLKYSSRCQVSLHVHKDPDNTTGTRAPGRIVRELGSLLETGSIQWKVGFSQALESASLEQEYTASFALPSDPYYPIEISFKPVPDEAMSDDFMEAEHAETKIGSLTLKSPSGNPGFRAFVDVLHAWRQQ